MYSVSTQNSGFNDTISSGGRSAAAFGAINFGSNSTLGGASTSANEGAASNWMLYVVLAAIAFLIFKR